MHYLQSAPKSPQLGGKGSAPPRPPHYYNYAQQNNTRTNPNLNSMQFQQQAHVQPHGQPQQSQQRPRPNPYQVNQLPEDNTIEDIDGLSGGGGGSNLVTIMLIGIVILILLGATGIGAYFLFFNKSSNKASGALNKAKGAQQYASADSDESGDSGDSQDGANASGSAQQQQQQQQQQTTTAAVDDIFVRQIFFQDTYDEEEFVGYSPQKPFLWNTLSTLDGVAQIFQDKGWKMQKGNTVTPSGHNYINLCEYFDDNRRNHAPTPISNAIDLCGYHLLEDPDHPLIFKALLKERQYPHQSGVSLGLVGIIFTVGTDGNRYGLTKGFGLQHMTLLPQQRRRLTVPTHLPDTNTMQQQQNRVLWQELSDNYHGTTYHDLEQEMDRLQQSSHTVHAQLIHDQGMDHALSYHPGAGPDYNYEIHFGQRGVTTHASPGWMGGTQQQRKAIQYEEGQCYGNMLSNLYFITATFRLKTRRTRDDPELEWHCHYKNPDERYPIHDTPFHPPMYQHPHHGVSQQFQNYHPRNNGPYRRLSMHRSGRLYPDVGHQSSRHRSDSSNLGSDSSQIGRAHSPDTSDGHLSGMYDEAGMQRAGSYDTVSQQSASIASQSQGMDGAEGNRIYLTEQYLDRIAEDQHTECRLKNPAAGYDMHSIKNICSIIEEIEGLSLDEEERRRLPECDCLDACGESWMISHKGKELEMQGCEEDIRLVNIEGVLKVSEHHEHYGDLEDYVMGHREYERDEGRRQIHFHDIPYWRCDLQEDVGDGDQDDEGQPPFDYDAVERRRNLMVEDGDDASSAFNMDNMYMIIGSTIFFIVVGIQSVYWLSHSY